MTASVIRRARRKQPCPCGCGTIGLCPVHKARLAAIREDFNAGRHAKSRDGHAEVSPGRSTCCYVGCWAPREPDAPFCIDHADQQTSE